MNVMSTYFSSASDVVIAVVLILLIASVISWAVIIKNIVQLTAVSWADQRLWKQLKSQHYSWSQLYAMTLARRSGSRGLSAIFKRVYEEYEQLSEQGAMSYNRLKRRLKLASTEQVERLEKGVSYLATLGSTAPYIGLFGTVWGIMRAFRSLGDVQQVTIAMLAPGIAEALVATAMGLFAAIPAVIFYNRFINQVDTQHHLYQMFEEEFLLAAADNEPIQSEPSAKE